ncbi:LysR family transcriptional regulator [Polymorphobacter sp. PAMC 29334]|uniref:LysR family transcriptional regulator n=1 Tax=Polymorphobacter sp. PAMC 29334 TaxID=2862331 RepID=UPI001D02AACC|nr:LysR family transcriptional regulator [Polymorphobacter sp. PAMC 29334]
MKAFLRVVETGSLSAAARSLAAPKSSISRSVARLESAVGTVLVERSVRGLRPTDAGILFAVHADRILAEIDGAHAALDELVGAPRGTLRINAAVTFAAGLIAPMLPAFLARYPDVRVVLETENRIIDLAREDADIAIRIGPLENSDLRVRSLGPIELWSCASPSYLAKNGQPTSVADLVGHRLFGWFDGPSEWTFTGPNGQLETVQVPTGTVVPEPIVFQALLVGGAGIGRLPDFLARGLIESGQLLRILPGFGSETTAAHALYPNHRSLSTKVRVFIDELINFIGQQTD